LPDDLTTLVAFYSSDDRTSFAAPWHGTLLLGTTDTEYDGDPRDAVASEDDVAELLAGGRRLLGDESIDRKPILSTWAGVRVLPRGQGDTRRAPREHVLATGPRGMISVAGGKLTTHRRIAQEVVALLPPELRPRRLKSTDEPLPGAAPSGPDLLEETVDAATATHLRSLYGGRAPALLDYADAPDAFERIHPSAPDVWAEVLYAREHEWACTVDDVLVRRTTLAHRGLATEHVREGIASRLAASPVPTSARV
jgi:glycerol-3-phosphate dehydrogenase